MFYIGDGVTAVISDLAITGGSWYYGGAIDNDGGTLTVDNCNIYGNVATNRGGGIYNLGVLTVVDSTITENSTTGLSGTMTSNGNGGGIYNLGLLTVIDSDISGNEANGYGGGIYNDLACILTLSNSTVSQNSATIDGAGVYNGGTATMINCTIAGNMAEDAGGGIADVGSSDNAATLAVTNCTIAFNTAEGDGGGICSNDYSTVTLANTIVAQNTNGESTSPDIYGSVTANFCVIGDDTGATLDDESGDNITNVDPGLETLADNGGPTANHRLGFRQRCHQCRQ